MSVEVLYIAEVAPPIEIHPSVGSLTSHWYVDVPAPPDTTAVNSAAPPEQIVSLEMVIETVGSATTLIVTVLLCASQPSPWVTFSR